MFRVLKILDFCKISKIREKKMKICIFYKALVIHNLVGFINVVKKNINLLVSKSEV